MTKMTEHLTPRMRDIRAAILRWVYRETAVNDNEQPSLGADDLANVIEWQSDPASPHEVMQACEWLSDQGYLAGEAVAEPGTIRPLITPEGVAIAQAGMAAHEDTTLVAPQGPTIDQDDAPPPAADSADAGQTRTLTAQAERAVAVADVMEQVTDGPLESMAEAHRIASAIKEEVARPRVNPIRLTQCVLAAVAVGTRTLDHAAAIDLVHLASHALKAV